MSRRKRGGYRSNSQKNLILGIITAILAILLGTFLWMDKVSEDKKCAELRALNKRLYQEEQEEAEALKQKEAADSF